MHSTPDEVLFRTSSGVIARLRDSGVRKALKSAAVDAGCGFPGFGLHAFRRANITMRQEEGGSAIEASKIAGHATVSQTGDYTIVQLKRQEELTRAIQGRRAKLAKAKLQGDEQGREKIQAAWQAQGHHLPRLVRNPQIVAVAR